MAPYEAVLSETVHALQIVALAWIANRQIQTRKELKRVKRAATEQLERRRRELPSRREGGPWQ